MLAAAGSELTWYRYLVFGDSASGANVHEPGQLSYGQLWVRTWSVRQTHTHTQAKYAFRGTVDTYRACLPNQVCGHISGQ